MQDEAPHSQGFWGNVLKKLRNMPTTLLQNKTCGTKVTGADATRNRRFIKFDLTVTPRIYITSPMQQTTPHHSETCQFQLRGTILALHLLQNLSKGLPVF